MFFEELAGLNSLSLLMEDSCEVLNSTLELFAISDSQEIEVLGLGKVLFNLLSVFGLAVVAVLLLGGAHLIVRGHVEGGIESWLIVKSHHFSEIFKKKLCF